MDVIKEALVSSATSEEGTDLNWKQENEDQILLRIYDKSAVLFRI